MGDTTTPHGRLMLRVSSTLGPLPAWGGPVGARSSPGSPTRSSSLRLGASIFYRDKRYRLLRGIEALMPVITSDVEQFFTSLRNQAVKSGS
jgi:hypothetical protein